MKKIIITIFTLFISTSYSFPPRENLQNRDDIRPPVSFVIPNDVEIFRTLDCDSFDVVREKELMITDLNVVEDPVRTVPKGAWHFGTLIRKMVGTEQDPSDFILNWLNEWNRSLKIGTFITGQLPITSRPNIQQNLINNWPRLPDGKLDLDQAPFRLLAIVNRVDLRTSTDAFNAGEGRFVFGVLDPVTQSPLSFTVIFEYHLPVVILSDSKKTDAKYWAEKFHNLNFYNFGEPTEGPVFNSKLQEITDLFSGKVLRGIKPLLKSTLNQIRTNEISIGPFWELREFKLFPAKLSNNVRLALNTTANSPDSTLNVASGTLENWLRNNKDNFINDIVKVPRNFFGGTSPENMSWLPHLTNDPDMKVARQKLALNTCNGCHTGESGTSFLHVSTRSPGQETRLSNFLTSGVTINGFDIPADLERRALDMQDILCPVSGALPMTPHSVGGVRVH